MVRLRIFNELRYYLNKLHLDSESPVCIFGFNIPDWIVHFYTMFLMNVTVIFLVRFCYLSNFDLAAMSRAMGVALGVIQLALIYTSVAANRNLIHETMNHLQTIVDERMYLIIFIL